jgi:pyruvate dehydrogenase E1 component alpha subunit/2-oxoisovalerate dehydrogenase E1 component alpha subunit
VLEDVYAEMPWHLKEQMAELMNGPEAPAHG